MFIGKVIRFSSNAGPLMKVPLGNVFNKFKGYRYKSIVVANNAIGIIIQISKESEVYEILWSNGISSLLIQCAEIIK